MCTSPGSLDSQTKKMETSLTKFQSKKQKQCWGQRVEFIEFGFSNSGYFYPEIYRVNFQERTLTREVIKNLNSLMHYEFEILGDEYHALKEYERTVPLLIERVREIEKKLNLHLYIQGARGDEVYHSPELGKLTSLVFPNPRSRARSLKEKIRFAHEFYVLMLAIDSILEPSTKEMALRVTHEDWPTLIADKISPPVTVWYQFSIEDWFEVVMRGVIALFKGTKIKRTHVKPDIMIFKGKYHSRGDILKDPPDRAVLIDAKVEMTQGDLRQLLEYRANFPKMFENTEFIVAAIEETQPDYRYKLEREGYRVIEQVSPDKPGEKEFQEAIRNIIETWKE